MSDELRVELVEATARPLGAGSRGAPWLGGVVNTALLEALELHAGGALEVEIPAAATMRGGTSVDPLPVVPLSAASSDGAQFLVVRYEDGTYRFVLPEAGSRGDDLRATYALPAPVDPALTRGIGSRAVRFAVERIVVPRVAGLAREAGAGAVGWWEARHRPPRLRWFRPADYRQGVAGDLDPGDVGSGRTLLVVPGTNSLSHSASGLGGLPVEVVRAFERSYGGRVIAFDHPTLSVSPESNAGWLAAWLGGCGPLELDVLTHSRGGLVARVLVEGAHAVALPPNVVVRTVTFVATPHRGTPLADPRHLSRLMERLVSLVPFSLAGAAGDMAAGALSTIRQLSEGVVGGLDGITAMAPGSSFLEGLNRPGNGSRGDCRYRTLAADFEPVPGSGLWQAVKDRGVDVVFEGRPNDAIIPTLSALQLDGEPGEGFDERLVFDEHEHVQHSSIFGNDIAARALDAWVRPRASPLPVAARKLARTAADVQSLAAVGPEWGLELLGDLTCFAPPAQRGPLLDLVRRFGAAVWPYPSGRGDEDRRPIVLLLPGIMGSALSVDGEPVWLSPWRLVGGAFSALRMGHGGGRVAADEVLCFAYRRLAEKLTDSGFRVVGVPYDWRLSLQPAAERLNQLLAALGAGEDDAIRGVPIHVVAHSLGGLVVRWARLCEPDTWRSRPDGSRVVLLGTPNHGSFAAPLALRGDYPPVRMLARIDWRVSLEEVVRQIWDFPGMVQLMPAPSLLPADVAARVYAASTWPGHGDGAPTNLALARDQHERLSADDGSALHVVLGDGVRTPAALRFTGDDLQVAMSPEGDGTVAVSCGVLTGADSVHYAPGVGHGELVKDPVVLQAAVDLLQHGATRLLASERLGPGVRGADRPAAEWLSSHEAGDRLDQAARGDRAGGATAAPAIPVDRAGAFRDVGADLGALLPLPTHRDDTELAVRVLNSGLEQAEFGVLIGHATGTPIAGAESRVDWLLRGQLTELHDLGLLPDRPHQTRWVPARQADARLRGALVVALDSATRLTPDALTELVVAAVVDYVERQPPGDEPIGVSAVPIGSGPVFGLEVGRSVVAILKGVREANRVLAQSMRRAVTVLEFVEQFSTNAEQVHWALRRYVHDLSDEDGGTSVLLAEAVESGEGWREGAPDPRYGEGRWERLRVQVDHTRPSPRGAAWLTYELARDLAAVSKEPRRVDRHVITQRVQSILRDPQQAREQGVALYEELLPTDLKDVISLSENLVLLVDDSTADIPWELLTDRVQSPCPLSASKGFVRQFSDSQLRPRLGRVASARALVIGDPPTGQYPRLPGAREEAQALYELLSSQSTFQVDQPRVFTEADAATSAMEIRTLLFRSDYRVIHIAAHGLYEQSPPADGARSGDVVGGIPIGAGSFLTADDLANLRMAPDLVFLNCCHLGVTEPGRGSDDFFMPADQGRAAASLARALMDIGVKAVVVAGWQVNDMAAKEFALDLYEEMVVEASDFGSAVKRVREAAYTRARGAHTTWAAYQCYGDPSFRLRPVIAAASPIAASQPIATLKDGERRLANLVTDISEHDPDEPTDELVLQLGDLEHLLDRTPWADHGRLLTLRARAWADLGEFDTAADLYRRAMETDNHAEIVAIEQYVNIGAREASGRWDLDPATASERLAFADEMVGLLLHLPVNAERASLLGGYHKRRAVIVPERRSEELVEATRWYRRAAELQPALYPVALYFQMAALAVQHDPPADIDLVAPPHWVALLAGALGSEVSRGNYWARMKRVDALLTVALLSASPRLAESFGGSDDPDVATLVELMGQPLGEQLAEIARVADSVRRAGSVKRDWRSTVDHLRELAVLASDETLRTELAALHDRLRVM